MKLFDRLDKSINYNSLHTLRKAMSILEYEFNLSIKNKNKNYSKKILCISIMIYNKLHRVSSNSSGLIEIKRFIGYLDYNIKNWN